MSQINNFPNNSNINYAGGPINTEQIEFDYYKCHARLAKDLSKQCKNSQKVGLYCKIHSNVDDVLSILNTVESNKKSTTKISKEPNKLRKNKIEATQVKFSAENYNNDEVLKKIVKLQKCIKGYLLRKNLKLHGIASFSRHVLNNDTDFLTYDSIYDIPLKFLYSYKDSKGLYWGFHVATFKELVFQKMSNPYTTCPIEEYAIHTFENLLKNSVEPIQIQKEIIDDPYMKLHQKCIKVFQIMDELKQYTQCEWFLDLDLISYKKLYLEMEDIWNYRIGLSNTEKQRYIKSGPIFTMKSHLSKIKDRLEIANILLNEFERLVSEGNTDSDKTTAALWILTGLTIVSKKARDALPWLYQSTNMN
jgi:hypothetical protein